MVWVVFTVLGAKARNTVYYIPYAYTDARHTDTLTHETRLRGCALRASGLHLICRVCSDLEALETERERCRERETTRRPARREIVDFYPVFQSSTNFLLYGSTNLRIYGVRIYGSTDACPYLCSIKCHGRSLTGALGPRLVSDTPGSARTGP
jgi:hypothetical protein